MAATTAAAKYSLHPHQGALEYIELVGLNGVKSWRLYQVNYKWWTSLISSHLKVKDNNSTLDMRSPPHSDDNELASAMHGILHFLTSDHTRDKCEEYGAVFRGTILLNSNL